MTAALNGARDNLETISVFHNLAKCELRKLRIRD